MIAYKGFRSVKGKLMCRDMEYYPGVKNIHDGDLSLCSSGFHACHKLYQVWYYYPNNGENVFWEVECGGEIIESKEGDGKFVCSELTPLRQIDTKIMPVYDRVYQFCNGLASVQDGKRWNYITKEGKLASRAWFDKTYAIQNGFGIVEKNGKYNFFTKDCNLLMDKWEDWDEVYDFENGFANVEKKGLWNCVDKNGEYVSKTWFEYIGPFFKGKANVTVNGRCGILDADGKITYPKKK